ncbi:MAG: hypothetical protein LAQ69_03365 [Acidobacteriia bacterium]|nr:hypothetical protein [Terriglobia bacterium]
MRRFIMYTVAIALIGVVSGVAAEPQQSRAFGRWGQVWGTWVWTINNQLPALVTLHIDGTVSVSDGRMFGGLQPNSTIRLTPLHGVWERTGFQSIGGTSLYLLFDATTGVLLAWGRSRVSITFADDFDHFQGKMFVETLPCAAGPPVSCPDPLAAGAKWVPNANVPADGLPISATRLERVPAGPLP